VQRQREDWVRNEYVRGSIGEASIVDKMRENSFKWFGRVMSTENQEAVRTVMEINIEGRRGRGRSKRK